MKLADRVISLEEFAEAFGKSPEWLQRNHRKLSHEKGMPEKCAFGWVWPRKAVEQWIDGEYGRAHVAEQLEHRLPIEISNQNMRLRERYARARA